MRHKQTRARRPDNTSDLKLPPPISAFLSLIQDGLPGAAVSIDAPDDPAGEWWLDLSDGRFATNVAWRPAKGFGVYTAETTFGEGPDEIYRKPGLAAQRIGQLAEQWRESKRIEPLWLTDVRALVGTPQTVLATALKCNQPAVSRFEQREDVKLSTLAAYIKAMGGRLEVRVHFADWDASIALPQ
jgi:hypothetical protein